VNGCDAVAGPEGEPPRLAIVEMKLGFDLDLLVQAVERMRVAVSRRRNLAVENPNRRHILSEVNEEKPWL